MSAMHWGVNLLGAAPPPAPVAFANNGFANGGLANNGFGEEEFGEFHDPIGEEGEVPQLEEGVEEGGGRMEELLRAAWRGEVDEVQRLVDQRREHGHTGVDPRYRGMGQGGGGRGETGSVPCLVLSCRPRIEATTNQGWTDDHIVCLLNAGW